MPNRILREGILTSERIALLGWAEEVFYRRLMSVVDDFGRYYANPMLLRSACYPLQIDKVSDADVGKWMSRCTEAALVSVYPAEDGKRYLQVLNFRQQRRAKSSKFPQPPCTCDADAGTCIAHATHMPADAHLGVCEGEGGGEGGSDRKRSLPPDFKISERVRAWAQEKGHSQLEERLEDFVGKAKAKGYKYVDWDEAFMTAVRKDWASLGTPRESRKARVAV